MFCFPSRTSLHSLALRGDVPALQRAVDRLRTCDVARELSAASPGSGMTPLMAAVRGGSLAAVVFLVEHGAQARVRSAKGESALSMAVAARRGDMVAYLLLHEDCDWDRLVRLAAEVAPEVLPVIEARRRRRDVAARHDAARPPWECHLAKTPFPAGNYVAEMVRLETMMEQRDAEIARLRKAVARGHREEQFFDCSAGPASPQQRQQGQESVPRLLPREASGGSAANGGAAEMPAGDATRSGIRILLTRASDADAEAVEIHPPSFCPSAFCPSCQIQGITHESVPYTREEYERFMEMDRLSTSSEWRFKKHQNGVDTYLMKDTNSPIYMIRGTCVVDAPTSAVAHFIHEVEHSAPVADTMYIEGRRLEEIHRHKMVYYAAYKVAWPLSSRDFCYSCSDWFRDDGVAILAANSMPHRDAPDPIGKYVRGRILTSGYVLRPSPDDPYSCSVTYMVQVDPRGSIPTWAVNMVAADQALNVARVRDHFKSAATRLQWFVPRPGNKEDLKYRETLERIVGARSKL